MNLGKRRQGIPIVLKGETIVRPQRVSFTKKRFDEGWLQELIRENPELLPVEEIEPAFAPLIAIGREVSVSVGAIDNLYLSPEGYLCLVETKLWRNPEARREVVGQIIDYAKEISQWSYEDLEGHVRAYNREYEGIDRGILDTLRQQEQIEEDDEAAVVDAISRNLQRGRFLLLIVGDGIRESVEQMAEYLGQTPQLYFTLALVELQVYEWEDESLLVIPQIVARTREVTRAIVRVEGSATTSVSVDVAPELVEKVTGKSILTEEDFLNILRKKADTESVGFARRIIGDMSAQGCLIDWQKASFVVKWPDPMGSGQNLTLFVVNTSGKVYNGWLARQLRSIGLSDRIAEEYTEESAQVLNCGVAEGYQDSWDRYLTLREVQMHFDRFSEVIQKTINKIKKAAEG